MLIAVLIALLPVLSIAVPPDQWIEETTQSSDGESPVLDSLEMLADSMIEPAFVFPGSPDKVRFQSSVHWKYSDGEQKSPSDLWARTRLVNQSGTRIRSEFFAVRRVGDPRAVDEVHLTVSSLHVPSAVQFTLGTYQLDWGLGVLSSSSFGASRSFSPLRSFEYTVGNGVVAKPASSESSWLRGIALKREFAESEFSLWASLREWNADTGDVPARLTGVLATNSQIALNRRDMVTEQLYGVSYRFQNKSLAAGALLQASSYDPQIYHVAKELISGSIFGSSTWNGAKAQAEVARSGGHLAWAATLSRGTENWQCAFYAIYADGDYFAPRSQSAFSFGGPLTDDRILGVRFGVIRNGHDLGLDMRANHTPLAATSGATVSQSDELIGSWVHSPQANIRLSARSTLSIRNEDSAGGQTERISSSIRIEPTWRNTLLWSLRAEMRSSEFASGDDRHSGTYLHLQAVRGDAVLRPGIRVAVFDLDGLSSPMLVYEPAVSGAYPIESFSGSGTRTSAWLSVSLASVALKFKIAHDSRVDSPDNTDFSFAFTYHR